MQYTIDDHVYNPNKKAVYCDNDKIAVLMKFEDQWVFWKLCKDICLTDMSLSFILQAIIDLNIEERNND